MQKAARLSQWCAPACLTDFAQERIFSADFGQSAIRAAHMTTVMAGDGQNHPHHTNSLEFPRDHVASPAIGKRDIASGTSGSGYPGACAVSCPQVSWAMLPMHLRKAWLGQYGHACSRSSRPRCRPGQSALTKRFAPRSRGVRSSPAPSGCGRACGNGEAQQDR